MSTFTLKDTGVPLDDFLSNLESFCQSHRADLSPAADRPLRGISRAVGSAGLDKIPASGSIVLAPQGWEEESQTPAERFLKLKVELHLVYSGLHEGQRLTEFSNWADRVAQTFIEHRSDFRGTGALPYLHDLILTPLEILPAQGLMCRGKILLVGLKRVKK